MKNRKKCAAVLLALAMCICLAACGDSGNAVPDSIENMAIDDSVACDYSSFLGTWVDESGNVLTVEVYERTRYDLSDSDDNLITAGDFQYIPDYGYVYANDDYKGVAYRCWFDESNALHIESLGVFNKVSGDTPGETVGDVIDYLPLAGSWLLDGSADALSDLEIDELGNWTLYERPDSDSDYAEVDCGTVAANPNGEEGQYYAVSVLYDDVVYDFVVAEEGVLYWGGEYDCYMRMP